MNVATPLLYRVVILRSKAQAYALERILRKYKEFGIHIKKLRVEGMVFLCTQSLLQPPMSLTFAFLWMYDHRIV
jgi:hypothetical protein